MKKLFMITLCLAVAAVIGCSKGSQEVEASGCDSFLGYVLNSCDPHPDQPKEKMKAGVGADIALWKHKDFQVDQETRANLNNGEFEKADISTYTVVTPNTGDKGLFQIVGDFLSGLFNKG